MQYPRQISRLGGPQLWGINDALKVSRWLSVGDCVHSVRTEDLKEDQSALFTCCPSTFVVHTAFWLPQEL